MFKFKNMFGISLFYASSWTFDPHVKQYYNSNFVH